MGWEKCQILTENEIYFFEDFSLIEMKLNQFAAIRMENSSPRSRKRKHENTAQFPEI
jgi:hypothetical protein